jgi:preprotein translocase subunit SecE
VDGARAAPPSRPLRADLPGALDHASGDVDEFDAALVRGAGGVAATPEDGLETREDGLEDDGSAQPQSGLEDDGSGPTQPEPEAELVESEPAPSRAGELPPSEPTGLPTALFGGTAVAGGVTAGGGVEALPGPGADLGVGGGGGGARPLAGGGRDGGGGGGTLAVGAAEGDRERPSPLRGPGRAVAFLQASWAELQRVQWPDRRQVAQATAVVLGFVAIAGAYLGLADVVAKEIVEFILS